MTTTAERAISTDTERTVIADAPGGVASGNAIVQVRDLKKYFPIGGGFLGLGGKRQWLKAIDGISFDIEPAQTFGLVGESGCGKTTTAKVLLGLEKPTDGTIYFEGHDVNTLTREGRKEFSKVHSGRVSRTLGRRSTLECGFCRSLLNRSKSRPP